MSDTQTALTVDFNQNAIRRGAIPTPDGALPSKRRSRRGMVDLSKWDAKVAADNAARGTSSTSESPTLSELIQANTNPIASPPAVDEKPKAPRTPSRPPAATTPPRAAPSESRGAINEDTQRVPAAPPIELPPPNAATVKAAKAALAAEAAAMDTDPTIPPPPPNKAATTAKESKPAK